MIELIIAYLIVAAMWYIVNAPHIGKLFAIITAATWPIYTIVYYMYVAYQKIRGRYEII